MAIEIGQKAPDVTLYNQNKEEVRLSDFFGDKLILAFFPGAFTGVCTNEICSLRDSMEQFNDFNTRVVAVNIDSPFANKAWAKYNNISFPVLSDFRKNAIEAYGIILHDFGGMKGYTTAKRSVFILDNDAIVRYKWVSDDPGVEPPYKEVATAVKEIK